MKTRFRYFFVLSVGLILSSFSFSFSQTNTTQSADLFIDADECGDPLKESQTYAYRQGKVTKILSANKVIVEFFPIDDPEGEAATIRLVGISSKKNSNKIKAFLNQHLLNQSVTVIGNRPEGRRRTYGGIITMFDHDEIDDLNEYLLENGIAYFSNFKSANLVPYYWPCRLEKAQERAKVEKTGLWEN